MASRALQYIVVPPIKNHTATVIFLHVSTYINPPVRKRLYNQNVPQGLGDSGEGWRPVANQLGKKEGLGHIKWILPHACGIPDSSNLAILTSLDVFQTGATCFHQSRNANAVLVRTHDNIDLQRSLTEIAQVRYQGPRRTFQQ